MRKCEPLPSRPVADLFPDFSHAPHDLSPLPDALRFTAVVGLSCTSILSYSLSPQHLTNALKLGNASNSSQLVARLILFQSTGQIGPGPGRVTSAAPLPPSVRTARRRAGEPTNVCSGKR